MKRLTFFVCIFSAIAALYLLPETAFSRSSASMDYGVLSGVIRNSVSGEGIAFVPVFDTETAGDGAFLVDSLPEANYNMMLAMTGYTDTTIASVQVRAGDTTHVEIQMRPLGGAFAVALIQLDGHAFIYTTYRDNTWRFFKLPLRWFFPEAHTHANQEVLLTTVYLNPVGGKSGKAVFDFIDHLAIADTIIDDFNSGNFSDWSMGLATNGSYLKAIPNTKTPDGSAGCLELRHGNDLFFGNFAGYFYKNLALPMTVYPEDTLSFWLKGLQCPYFPDNPLDYYPLHIGDIWEYERKLQDGAYIENSYPRVEVTGDTVMPNNMQYKVIEHSFMEDQPLRSPFYTFERIDSATANVYGFIPELGDEVLRDSLKAIVGDSIPNTVDYGGRWLHCFAWDSSQVLDTDTHTKSFRPYLAGYERQSSRFFGLTYETWSEGFRVTVKLAYARINGVEYGKRVTGIPAATRQKPAQYILAQNYPNPFNPETTIRFYLPQSGPTMLTIYDVRGRIVKRLLENNMTAGPHSLHVNARELASGVYFYELKSGNFRQVKKMMILK